MKAPLLFASFLSAFKQDAAHRPRGLHQPLDTRVREHLSAFAHVQSMLDLGAPRDRLPEWRELILDAASLADHIASIADYREIDPLHEAYRVLVEHWKNMWSNGGV